MSIHRARRRRAFRVPTGSCRPRSPFPFCLRTRSSWARPRCVATFRGGFEIALWVRAQDLRAVTTRPVSRSYADGSLVQIARGAPVGDVTLQGRWIDDDTWSFALDVPGEAVGTRYAPIDEQLAPSPSPSTDGRIHSCTPLPFGGGHFALEESVAVKLTPSTRRHVPRHLRIRLLSYARPRSRDGDRRRRRRASTRLPRALPRNLRKHPLARTYGPDDRALEGWRILYWPNRTRAGRALNDARIEGPLTEGDRTCFRMSLTLVARASLCSDPADIVAE